MLWPSMKNPCAFRRDVETNAAAATAPDHYQCNNRNTVFAFFASLVVLPSASCLSRRSYVKQSTEQQQALRWKAVPGVWNMESCHWGTWGIYYRWKSVSGV